jgi:hypothetical protein
VCVCGFANKAAPLSASSSLPIKPQKREHNPTHQYTKNLRKINKILREFQWQKTKFCRAAAAAETKISKMKNLILKEGDHGI